MKVNKEVMAEHRELIIASAAKRFRERGFDGISVAELMKEAGLTHGGFYGHFSSKQELTALAAERAFREMADKWENWIEDAKGNPLEAFGDAYLSLNHLNHPERGCVMAACGSELARQPSSVKEVVTEGMKHWFEVVGKAVSEEPSKQRNNDAISVLATAIGGMILARSVSDPNLRDDILKTVAESVSRDAQRFAKAKSTRKLENTECRDASVTL